MENFDVEADTFLRRERIHIAADRIDLPSDGFGGARLRSLEHHVLDKVGDAIPLRIFVARARLEPDTDRDRADVGHLFGDNGQAVRQDLTTDAAGLFYHDVVTTFLTTTFLIDRKSTRLNSSHT